MSRILPFLLATAALAQTPGVRLPEYTREVLPNGATLALAPQAGVPLISVTVTVKGGAESDPANLAGLAQITAELLRRGAGARSAERFSEDLDFIGAEYDASVDAQSTAVSVEFLAKDTDRALELLADAVLRPTFPEAEVKKALSEAVEQAKSVKDSPMAAAGLYYQAFFYGPEHPYGRAARGDELSLPRIRRQDITAYHARMYAGANLIVTAAGDFEAAAMRARLAKAFGAAPAGQAYAWRKDAAAAGAGEAARLLLVDKPDATQTYFWIGGPAIHRTHPDRAPVWIVNTLFGDRFTSMLNDELRVNSGLTYGAVSRFDQNRLPGRLSIFTYTRSEDTVKAIDLALEVLRRLREKGISAEQLASAKAYIKGIYPTENLETPDQIAGALADLELFGLPRTEVDGLFARIDAVTLEQANAAIQKHFGAGALTFTLVGPAAKIRDSVKKYAPAVSEVPIAKPGLAAK